MVYVLVCRHRLVCLRVGKGWSCCVVDGDGSTAGPAPVAESTVARVRALDDVRETP